MAIGAGVLITRSITRPIGKAVNVAETVARGDLGSRIDAEGTDETSHLLAALADMNTRLTQIVDKVRGSSGSIAGAARQIAAGNADLSQRTEAQASSLQETAASMEELTSTVKQNADNAQHATELAATASEVAQKGNAVVSQVVSTMQDISDRSGKIAEITSIIEGIAFQINILALNAAVEAARAGDQGRGFAVVANEVQPRAALFQGGQGDQGADRLVGRAHPRRLDAGGRSGPHHDGGHRRRGARHAHHAGDRVGLGGAAARHRAGQPGHLAHG